MITLIAKIITNPNVIEPMPTLQLELISLMLKETKNKIIVEKTWARLSAIIASKRAIISISVPKIKKLLLVLVTFLSMTETSKKTNLELEPKF